jgi:hypothetical protein
VLLYGIVWVVWIVWCRYSGIGQKYSINGSTGSREGYGEGEESQDVCVGVSGCFRVLGGGWVGVGWACNCTLTAMEKSIF